MKKCNLHIGVLLCFLLSLCLFWAAWPQRAAAAEISQQTVDEFYYENRYKEEVKRIDPDGAFDFYYNAFVGGGDVYYQKMQDVVTVATCLDSAIKSFEQANYDATEWLGVQARLKTLVSDCKIVTDFDKSQYIDKISAQSSSIVSDFLTKAQKFEILVQNCIEEVRKKYDGICSKVCQGDEIYRISGAYDATARLQADEIFSRFIQYSEEIEFTLQTEAWCKAEIKQLRDEAIERLDNVDRNDIERGYGAVMDYYAALDGFVDGNIGDLKSQALEKANKVKNDILPVISDEVYEKYSAQISVLCNFLNGEKDDGYEKLMTNVVRSGDGVISIIAVEKTATAEIEYNAFYPDDKVVVHDASAGAARRNAQNALSRYTDGVSVAYFAYIDVYRGSNILKTESVSPVGNEIVYRVVINLNKYYEVCVVGADKEEYSSDDTAVKVKKFVTKNRTEEILSLGSDVLKNGKTDGSVCYGYSVKNGESVLEPLNFNIDVNGGILMFETKNLATFLIAKSGNEAVYFNPLFWLIVICCVIAAIFVAVLILRNITYNFKFISNGGSKVDSVKVKKGDAFALPDSPTKDGFIFGGWYIDKKCSIRFVETRLGQRRSQKVYAKWYECDVPHKYKKYYEALRGEMLCYSKVGPLATLGVVEREILAKLYADKNGVYLYTAIDYEKAVAAGFNVSQANGEYAETPSKAVVTDGASFEEAMSLIAYVMSQKGLQNIGLASEEDLIVTEKKRKEGFVFVIENDTVAHSLEDYFDLIRVYMKSYVLRNPSSSVKNGSFLTRMYLGKDAIELYLALLPFGDGVENAADRFEDTPALVKVTVSSQELQHAYDLIDKVMTTNGFERENENANNLTLEKPQPGCGVASIVKTEEGDSVSAVSVEDCFNNLRVYIRSFALYNTISSVKEGDCVTRMYYNGDSISLYLALATNEIGVSDASDKFQDTPALVTIGANLKGMNTAYELIDKVMAKNGFIHNSENAQSVKLSKPQKGEGMAFRVKFEK